VNENDICWCGHVREVHFVDYEGCCDEHCDYEYPICSECETDDEHPDVNPDHEFELDNLRMLELIDEQRIKS